MNERCGYVYILANSFKKLYVGMSTELMVRVSQHKNKTNPDCHTAKYGIHRLVYFERYGLVIEAIRREKVLKGWLRVRKIELIVAVNPTWRDLSEDWGKQAVPYDLEGEAEMMRMTEAYLGPTALPLRNAGVLRFAQDDGEKQATARDRQEAKNGFDVIQLKEED